MSLPAGWVTSGPNPSPLANRIANAAMAKMTRDLDLTMQQMWDVTLLVRDVVDDVSREIMADSCPPPELKPFPMPGEQENDQDS